MNPSKTWSQVLMVLVAFLMAACSHLPSTGGSGGGGNGGGGGTGPFTISGSVVGLTGTGLVLENNGTSGAEDITITGSGTVNFAFTKTTTGAYGVTVKTQPTSQVCTVANGSGTAKANVGNVEVSCGVVYTIGGTISGLLGSGLVLKDTVGTFVDTLTITSTGTVSFTFNTPVSANANYAVTVGTQPTNPAQTCSVTNGTGTTTGNVTNIQILCPAPTFTIGGTLVGLVNGAGDTIELQNNGGDNIFVTGNNTSWAFPTPVTANGHYNVNIFFDPTSQPQPCWIFYYTGVATANVNSVIVDCQHNDWTWIFGPDTTGSLGTYGTAQLPPPLPPAQNLNTPGGRDFPATWTDKNGQKWMFGGYGMPVQGVTPPVLPGLLNDLWVFSPQLGGIWIPANLPISRTTTVANGVTTIVDSTSNVYLQLPGDDNPQNPDARWGSVSWTDSATGDLYLFGGQTVAGNIGLANDVWKFTPGPTLPDEPANGYDTSYSSPSINPTVIYTGAYTYTGTWTKVGAGGGINAAGTYPASPGGAGTPGGRWGAAFCTDATGTLWMFGGQGFDGTGTLGLLNDLWKYSGGTWTWMGPSNSTKGQNNGVYGTLGTGATGNAPGGRQTAVLWADNAGNIWMFGGLGLDSVGTSNPGSLNGGLPNGTTPEGALLNDLWKFNISSGEWTWVSGGGTTGIANQVGVYGTQQTAASGDVPGSRWSAGGWADSSGNLWFFGGWGYASSLAQSTGFLDDVWEYLPGLNQWIWWKGSSNVNQNGIYATEQFGQPYYVPFVQNQPGARRGFGLWQPDSLQYVWVFGGQGYDKTSANGNGYVNDFWTYLGFPKYPNQ